MSVDSFCASPLLVAPEVVRVRTIEEFNTKIEMLILVTEGVRTRVEILLKD